MKFSFLILSIFLSALYFECKSQNIIEAFLIPKEYRGKVVTVYNRPFGERIKSLNDTIYYTIPKDGISISKSQIKSKLEDCIFYQFNTRGKKEKLRILSYDLIIASPDSNFLKNQVGIFIFGTIGSCNSKEPQSFCYSDFYVGSLNDMKNHYTPKKSEQFMLKVSSKARWKK